MERREKERFICEDPLAAARGIVNGLLIVIPFWALVVLVVVLVRRG